MTVGIPRTRRAAVHLRECAALTNPYAQLPSPLLDSDECRRLEQEVFLCLDVHDHRMPGRLFDLTDIERAFTATLGFGASPLEQLRSHLKELLHLGSRDKRPCPLVRWLESIHRSLLDDDASTVCLSLIEAASGRSKVAPVTPELAPLAPLHLHLDRSAEWGDLYELLKIERAGVLLLYGASVEAPWHFEERIACTLPSRRLQWSAVPTSGVDAMEALFELVEQAPEAIVIHPRVLSDDPHWPSIVSYYSEWLPLRLAGNAVRPRFVQSFTWGRDDKEGERRVREAIARIQSELSKRSAVVAHELKPVKKQHVENWESIHLWGRRTLSVRISDAMTTEEIFSLAAIELKAP